MGFDVLDIRICRQCSHIESAAGTDSGGGVEYKASAPDVETVKDYFYNAHDDSAYCDSYHMEADVLANLWTPQRNPGESGAEPGQLVFRGDTGQNCDYHRRGLGDDASLYADFDGGVENRAGGIA